MADLQSSLENVPASGGASAKPRASTIFQTRLEMAINARCIRYFLHYLPCPRKNHAKPSRSPTKFDPHHRSHGLELGVPTLRTCVNVHKVISIQVSAQTDNRKVKYLRSNQTDELEISNFLVVCKGLIITYLKSSVSAR